MDDKDLEKIGPGAPVLNHLGAMSDGHKTIPASEISVQPQVKWSDLNVRRYDPLRRAKDRSREEVGQSIWWQPSNPEKVAYRTTQPRYAGKIPIRKDA
jgi:hypothetical protein